MTEPHADNAASNLPDDAPQDSSRRGFLMKTAMLATASAALASCTEQSGSKMGGPKISVPKGAPGKPVSVSDSQPINIGVIGTGGMGTGHCHRIIDLSKEGKCNARLVALSDVCKPRLDSTHKACEQKQGSKIDTYRYYADLLARDDIHAVLIASPEHWHAQMALDAIHAGKDVYLEKPMTLRFHEARMLKEAVDNSDRVFQVGTQHIMQPKYQEAKKLLSENALGRLTMSQTSYCRNSTSGEWNYYHVDPKVTPGEMLDWEAWCGPMGVQPWDPFVYARWRRYRTFSTGIVGDLLVHMMTPLIYAMEPGWPVRTTGSGSHIIDMAMENHDQVNITIQFEDGHTMIVAGSTCNEVGLETMVRGHQANMRLGGSSVVVRPERIFVDEVDEVTVNTPGVPDQDLLRLNWMNCIRTRKPTMSNVEMGTKIIAIVDMATRSMWEGGAFGFDPDTMTIKKL